jgi:hypothetical protein
MEGWIKIHRKMIEWEWYKKTNTKSLFFHLLLMANHKPNRHQGLLIEIGCLVTSYEKLSVETGISVRSIRTALDHLKLTSEIAIKTSSQGTHIQILKYTDYQTVPSELPNDCQTTAKRLPTNKNEKNKKNEKNTLTASPLEGEHFIFNTPEKMTTEQELDMEIFWNSLLSVYKPEGDKALYNTKLVKQQKRIIAGFTPEERSRIITWFVKYKTQLGIVNPWISNFFKTHPTIDDIANYFRSIKDVKEGTTKPKYQTRNEIKRNVLTEKTSSIEDF